MSLLISVNPYKNLDIYNEKNIFEYKNFFHNLKINQENLFTAKPHLFCIAEAAYQDMLNEKKNQSIIISGESGSGKTESLNIILKYLTVSSILSDKNLSLEKKFSEKFLFSNFLNEENEKKFSVEKKILDSNPLIETFGNAKTLKNKNSSRFGKFFQIYFSNSGKILSGKFHNYLLEKSRVTSISPFERSYHIFYQIIRGADPQERIKYKIKEVDYFSYLSKGFIESTETNDSENYIQTKLSMLKLKFKPEEIAYIFNVIMGILYLGNITFIVDETILNKEIIINPLKIEDFKIAAELLGIDEIILTKILTKRKTKDLINDIYSDRFMTIDQVYNSRDCIAQIIYSKIFDFLIKRVNQAISNLDEMKISKVYYKIGILDIFGFENFEVNSFEQLCINYANERLQQYFNYNIFKLEQEEYKNELVNFDYVEFKDNNDIINLIDDPKISIFSLLDSEGILPNCSDEQFENNVYKYLEHNNFLGEKKIQDFITVNHYAGEVYYHTTGFIKKNTDHVTQDILYALQNSKSKLIKKIFEKRDENKSTRRGSDNSLVGIPSHINKIQSDSLCKQFKRQLDDLFKILGQSNPRYVMCIKPNSEKIPGNFESLDVLEQLISGGILETVKIRKQGYSIRKNFEEFFKRYKKLCPELSEKIKPDIEEYNFKELTIEMCKYFSEFCDNKKYFYLENKFMEFGVSKIFMKEEVKDYLELKLNIINFIQKIQKNIRRWLILKRIRKLYKSILKNQAVFKGFQFRKK